jgi:uncharacterized membrane protein (DUF4010 family)
METVELFQRLSVALAVGLLIGLERGWRARGVPEGERTAGLRTHAIASLLGAVWGAIAQRFGGEGAIALGVAFAVFGLAIIIFRFREISHDETFGATTVIAAMLAFTLGAYALVGNIEVTAAVGVAATGLLALKEILHNWVRRLTWPELRSAIALLAMAFVLPPLLPDRTIDPWHAINPSEIWRFTILIAGISFLGYVAVKVLGEQRGVAVAGLVGGLTSSTAVTLTMSNLARDYPRESSLLAAGAIFSSVTMIARVLLVVALVDFALIGPLLGPFCLAALVLAAAGVALLYRAIAETNGAKGIEMKNPLDIPTVLKFGALLTVVMALAKIVTTASGDAGLYGLAALSGVADVDAITLSSARLARDGLDPEVGAWAIAVAVAVNTASKAVLGWYAGGAGFGWRLAVSSSLAIVAGLAGFFLLPAFQS